MLATIRFCTVFAFVFLASCQSSGSGGDRNGGEGGDEAAGAGGENNNAGNNAGGSEQSGGSAGSNEGGTTASGGAGGVATGGTTSGGAGGSRTGGAGGTRSGGAGGGGSGGTAAGGAMAFAGSPYIGGMAGTIPSYTAWPFNTAEAVKRQSDTAAALGLPVEVNLNLGGGVVMTMVVIPAGDSTLGTPTTATDYEGDERLHAFKLNRPLLIAKTPFTRGMYRALLGSFPVQPMSGASRAQLMSDSVLEPALAMYRIAQDTVRAALQARAPAGWTFRLPTQDEWEYAARAGTATLWYTGDTPADLAKIAWYEGNSGHILHDVGGKTPNPWGVHDMIGNAWHWIFLPGPGGYTDADPRWHLVRGCTSGDVAFGNGCRTGNRQISDTGEQYRFVADVLP